MALQFLDKRLVGAYIMDAWQNHFDTEIDPADGQWFTNGPDNNHIGLYGGLTDTLASELIFDESKQIFTPRQKEIKTATFDNLNGLAPSGAAKLIHSYENSTSSTH